MYREQAQDEIRIQGLKVFAHHGVYEEETVNGQDFYVNAVLYTRTCHAAEKDDLEKSTNYGEVCLFIDRWMRTNTFKLLETVAEKLARAILLTFPLVSALDLEINKPQAPIPLPFENVSVKIHRGWHRAFVAVGSNMGDKRRYVEDAITALGDCEDIAMGRISTLIETEPYGGVEQDGFVNGVMELYTLYDPFALLEKLHEIENAAGRKRLIHWGPRTLDLDILFYDRLVMDSEDLTIPHADISNRDFVLVPMAEIAPGFVHPATGKNMQQMLKELQERQ